MAWEMPQVVHSFETILLVEDESSVHVVAKKVLETFGYRILVATAAWEVQNLFFANESEIAPLSEK